MPESHRRQLQLFISLLPNSLFQLAIQYSELLCSIFLTHQASTSIFGIIRSQFCVCLECQNIFSSPAPTSSYKYLPIFAAFQVEIIQYQKLPSYSQNCWAQIQCTFRPKPIEVIILSNLINYRNLFETSILIENSISLLLFQIINRLITLAIINIIHSIIHSCFSQLMGKSTDSFKYAFLPVSLIGFLCCLDRADFNLPLGIFAFLLWSQSHFPQKHRILWVLFFSIIGDLLWVIIVSVVQWSQQPVQNYNLRSLTQVGSIINMVYKIILVVFAMCNYDQCSDLLSFESFKTKFLYL